MKHIKLLFSLLLLIGSIIYTIPNFYASDICLDVASDRQSIDRFLIEKWVPELQKQEIIGSSLPYRLIVNRLTFEQRDAIKRRLSDRMPQMTIALNVVPHIPLWMKIIRAFPMKQGLDLRGGVQMIVEVDFNDQNNTDDLAESRKNKMNKTLSVIRHRVDALGIAEALVQQQGDRRILIEFPGVLDASYAKKILGTTATLEFRWVGENESALKLPYGPNGSMQHRVPLEPDVILDGSAISYASFGYSEDQKPAVVIDLDRTYESDFHRITASHIGRSMAIVYVTHENIEAWVHGKKKILIKKNKRIISVATVQSALGSHFQVTGLSQQEAQDLALLLRSGSLPASIRVVGESILEPKLGSVHIKQGFIACCGALIFSLIFMGFYYAGCGILANILLLFNILMLIAILSILGMTLTIPGIAGLVLTIGIAVDAHVLIFERAREEYRKGQALQDALQLAYQKVFLTILDANMVTLAMAMILFGMGAGPVRGFAVTLFFGVMTSFLSSFWIAKSFVPQMAGRFRLSIGVKRDV